MPAKYIKVVTSSSEMDTLLKYVSAPDSPAYVYNDSMDELLAIKGNTEFTNRQRIEMGLPMEWEIFKGAPAHELPLPLGTTLYLLQEKVNNISFLVQGLEVVSTDVVAFKAAKLAELESDTGYVSVQKPVTPQFQSGDLKVSYPELTVWMWCRSISSKSDRDGELKGQFIDLSPFIDKITTNVGKNGGNFQISLPPLVAEVDGDQKWVVKRGSLQTKTDSNGKMEHYVSYGSLFDIDNREGENELVRNTFLFNNIIHSNDLVFIRFETLKSESRQRYIDSMQAYIDNKSLPGRIYDMIGLVDSSSIVTSAANNDVNINISGRDLSKLFIDDGTYFYALENRQGVANIIGGSTMKNSLLSRIAGDKSMYFIGLGSFVSIENILKYIVQQLSNIKMVPNNLFEAYGDRRNTRFNEIGYEKQIKRPTNYTPNFEEELSNGIWQIVKLVVDKSISQRRLADTSFSTAQGSLLNFINNAIQEPLCEFYMDTYGDQFHLIARKPPHDQKSLVSLLEGRMETENGVPATAPAIIDIDERDVISEVLTMDDSQVYSWYQFYPQGAIINEHVDYSTHILPAIYFEEYAEVFGSRPFQRSHKYVPYVPNSFDSQFGNVLYEQAYSDLKYVIESSQYLPFSRKGTLTLNRDRRIKIGNIIRYKPTGEIFHVDHVAHNHHVNSGTIDATTVVQVSRGLVEQFIYGIHLKSDENDGKRIFVSYFNLIDTRQNLVYKEVTTKTKKSRKIGSRVIPADIKEVRHETLEIQSQSNNFITKENTGILAGFISEESLLHPEKVTRKSLLDSYTNLDYKRKFIKFVNGITSMGMEVTITSAYRTAAEQFSLWVKDKRNARPGSSKHNHSSAIDINVVKSGIHYRKSSSEAEWRNTGVPALANSMGIKWGGNNDGTFGTKGQRGYYEDRVHFEITGISSSQHSRIEDIYEDYEETVTTKGIDHNSVFTNYKVNKYTFNFFLKNLQFDPKYRKISNKQIYNSDQAGTRLDGAVFGDENLNEVIIKSKTKKR